MNLVMIALQDGRGFQDLLKALRAAGAHSATILDNVEMDILFWRGIRASMSTPVGQGGPGKTVLTVVPDVLTDSVVEAAERALVGLTGMVFAWQVDRTVGFQGEARAGEPAWRSA